MSVHEEPQIFLGGALFLGGSRAAFTLPGGGLGRGDACPGATSASTQSQVALTRWEGHWSRCVMFHQDQRVMVPSQLQTSGSSDLDETWQPRMGLILLRPYLRGAIS